jgi:hypothetical protein
LICFCSLLLDCCRGRRRGSQTEISKQWQTGTNVKVAVELHGQPVKVARAIDHVNPRIIR